MRILKQLTTALFTGLMLISCVTINIYFPAAAAEKAADRIIEDIWGEEGVVQPEAEKTSLYEASGQGERFVIVKSVLDWLVPPAAAEADLNISSPAINTLQKQMKARHSSLKSYYSNGAIGLTEQGLLAIHNAKVVSLKDRNKVKALLADENKDRQALYAELARANGHPEWKADIQATFARRWVDKASKGWWYETGGTWQQK